MSLSLSLLAPSSDPLAELRRIFRNSLTSAHTKRAYIAAFNQFFTLAAESGRSVSRALLMEYRAQMIDCGLSASTINVRLSAIRKLISEARENNLLDPLEAARILTVPGVPTRGTAWTLAHSSGSQTSFGYPGPSDSDRQADICDPDRVGILRLAAGRTLPPRDATHSET